MAHIYTVRFAEADAAALDGVRARYGMSVNEQVRRAVRAWMARGGPEALDPADTPETRRASEPHVVSAEAPTKENDPVGRVGPHRVDFDPFRDAQGNTGNEADGQ